MARFYVGQKVRIVCPSSNIHMEETTVTSVNARGIENDVWFDGIEVDIPCGKSKYHSLCVFEPHELEPLTDSYDVASWDTCIWKPEHLRVKA